MATNFRMRRVLALMRRDREARMARLRKDLCTWAWWRFVLSARVMPVLLIAFFGWTFGVTSGMTWMAKEIEARYTCEVKHAN